MTNEPISQAEAAKISSQHQQLSSLASVLARPDSVAPQVVKGVVTAVDSSSSPPSMSIQLSGDTSSSIPGVRYLDSYSPTVGDTVLVVRQANTLFGLGQINDGGSHADNGWTAPSLGGGFTTHTFDPVLYRLVYDNGSRKVQIRGRVNISGTPSALWTMPSHMRPSFNIGDMLLARGWGGGAVACQLQVNANGTMVLTGTTVTGPAAQHGNLATDNRAGTVDHYHFLPSTGTNTNGPVFPGANSHFHITNFATHTHPVSAPDWISFNGVEYFI